MDAQRSADRDLCTRRAVDAGAVRRGGGTEIGGLLRCERQSSSQHLQGYFDYRPKDTDEAVAAASSDDAGITWNFQQKVLELRTTCPTQLQKDPDGDKDNVNNGQNDDNGDDDGQGHQFILTIAGHTYLYTLDRAVNHIDFDDL